MATAGAQRNGTEQPIAVELPSAFRAVLEDAASRAGVPLSEYVRDAALARAVSDSFLSDAPRFERLAQAIRDTVGNDPDSGPNGPARLVVAALARLKAAETREESRALVAQAERAVSQAENHTRQSTSGDRHTP